MILFWHFELNLAGLKDNSASTTLADLLTPLFVANPISAMRALLRRWSSEEFEDGVAHGWQSRLRRRPVDSFFPPCCCEAAMLEEGVRDHRHERGSIDAITAPPHETIGRTNPGAVSFLRKPCVPQLLCQFVRKHTLQIEHQSY